jgi:uncharacterized protein YggU (UPF0235/DUF167 family)
VTKLALRVTPGADRTRVTGRLADGRLQVRVAAAPEKGEANAELVQFLARALGLPRVAVRVARGRTSRDKLMELDIDATRLRAWTESLGG